MTERLHFHFLLSCIEEGNGNPLQCSCLENPRDGGAWWAAVYGVAQSQTRLKRLSSSSSNAYIWNLERSNDNPIYETAKETQMYRTVFGTLCERVRVGWFGRMALKNVYYHMWNDSPFQVQCMIQDAQGWCTGMTQRDGMGRVEGGGFKMVNTGTPVADSCQCMAKPIQYCN